MFNPQIAILGFGIGLLVGMTGMGGAALMTPLLIYAGGVRPLVAVGSDLVYSAATKIFGAWQHARQKTVDFSVVKLLAVGSVPGALLGSALVRYLSLHYSFNVDHILTRILGATLVLVALFLFARALSRNGNFLFIKHHEPSEHPEQPVTIVLGAIVGFLVGLTSVGSGSLIVPFLILLYPLTAARVVGTDIFHAAILTTVAGAAHLLNGNVDFALVGNLLLGSIPGVLLGGHLTIKIPQRILRGALAIALFASGIKLL